MLDKLRANIAERALIAPNEKVLVAVSGGVDSMVLLACLEQIPAEIGVAHFNHKLRGKESDQDQEFVQDRALALGLPLFFDAADVKAYADVSGLSIEMAARDLRHLFLARAAEEFGAKKVALAHHADDQVETFWLRLLRGNAGQGLSGMRWQNPSPTNPRIQLIRPLLNISKREIQEFAVERKIRFREDSSNVDVNFQRNRIRQEILPMLEQYQPKLREITLRTLQVLTDEKEFLRGEAETTPYSGAHPAVQREILRRRLVEMKLQTSFELIEALRASTQAINVADGLSLRRTADGQIVSTEFGGASFQLDSCTIDPGSRGGVVYSGREVKWETVAGRGRSEPGVEYFDADVLGSVIHLRHWWPGDRFQPIGLPVAAKVQDLFVNLKVPERERHERILAVAEGGEIFWIEGLRIGEAAKIRPETKRILKWSWSVWTGEPGGVTEPR